MMTRDKVLNWLLGGAGAVALVIFYQFLQWQVAEQVAAAVNAANGVTPSQLETLAVRVGNLETIHEKDVDRVEGKAERIAQILMEQ